jgi:hypothetical protein
MKEEFTFGFCLIHLILGTPSYSDFTFARIDEIAVVHLYLYGAIKNPSD